MILRAFIRELFAVGLRLGVYLGLLALVAMGAYQAIEMPVGIASADIAPLGEWIDVARPHAAFALNFAEIPDPSPGYAIKRDPATGDRKDILTFAGGGRVALVEIYRPGPDRPFATAATRDIAVLASTLGRTEAIRPAPPIDSKFGPVAVVDFELTDGANRRGCLGFVHTAEEPRIRIAGWMCQREAGMVARPGLACALDRLTLLSAGSDQKMARFFARAELETGFCGRKRTGPGTKAGSADWIDAPRGPPLRAGRAASDGLSAPPETGYTGGEYRLRTNTL